MRNVIVSSKIEELKHLDSVFSADSFRTIGTAKYVAEINNLKIKLDNRINERNLGVNTISELPENQTLESFKNMDYKFGTGESLNEVDKRFNSFINEILESNYNNIALFIHGIIMMSFLQNNTSFSFDGKNMRLLFNNKEIYNDKMKNPMVFKIEYEYNVIVDIKEISIN